MRTPWGPDGDEGGTEPAGAGAVASATADGAMSAGVAAALFPMIRDAAMILDRAAGIVAVNPAFSALTGYDAGEVVGRDPSALGADARDAEAFRSACGRLGAGDRWAGRFRSRHKDGAVHDKWLSVAAARGEDGVVGCFVATLGEPPQRVAADADHDALTGLPDRARLLALIEAAIGRAARAGGRVAVLDADLDEFRAVNEVFGHGVGDMLLAELGRRMKACLRDGDVLGRLGGDEFLAVVPAGGGENDPARLARRLLRAVARPLSVKGRRRRVRLTASVGIAVHPDDADTADKLLAGASLALRQAKSAGRNTFRFAAGRAGRRSPSLEARLRRAVERGEMVLHYQPRVDLASGRVSGMEALVRWDEPGRPLLGPGDFVPLAEETGVIVPLGEWVLAAACAAARRWHDAGHAGLRMAVNLSARQLVQPRFVADVRRVLDQTGLAPDRLDLEITETSLMERADDAVRTLRRIQAMGVHLVADDFGTGYSSLNYLRNFPLNAIKIDRAFVGEIRAPEPGTGEGGGARLAAAVIAVGRSLGLKVVAEGVEKAHQLEFLRRLACDEVQGYWYSRPLPAETATAFLERESRP